MPDADEPAAAVEEVRGIFPSDAALQDAIGRLTQAGFDRADLSLPAVAPSPMVATPEQGAENPDTETDDRQLRTLETSMAGAVGALAAAGVVIGTGGAALPAVAAAAAVGVGAGATVHAARSAASSSRHEQREADANNGQLILSARAARPGKREQAESLMRSAGAFEVFVRPLGVIAPG